MGKVIAQNRKARFDYFIFETWEAGVILSGSEVKSLREGRANLRDSFARVEEGEVFLYNLHIPPYDQGSHFNPDPVRTRKLLLHQREIKRLIGKTQERGLTLVPLKIYFKRGWVKVEIGLAKGKKTFDKRRQIAEREAKREMERAKGMERRSKLVS